jgi:hypothetical protein
LRLYAALKRRSSTVPLHAREFFRNLRTMTGDNNKQN